VSLYDYDQGSNVRERTPAYINGGGAMPYPHWNGDGYGNGYGETWTALRSDGWDNTRYAYERTAQEKDQY